MVPRFLNDRLFIDLRQSEHQFVATNMHAPCLDHLCIDPQQAEHIMCTQPASTGFSLPDGKPISDHLSPAQVNVIIE